MSKRSSPSELFSDLVYFLPIHSLARRCPSNDTVADVTVYFMAVFNAWLGDAFFNTRFDSEDMLSRLYVTFLAVALCLSTVFALMHCFSSFISSIGARLPICLALSAWPTEQLMISEPGNTISRSPTPLFAVSSCSGMPSCISGFQQLKPLHSVSGLASPFLRHYGYLPLPSETVLGTGLSVVLGSPSIVGYFLRDRCICWPTKSFSHASQI